MTTSQPELDFGVAFERRQVAARGLSFEVLVREPDAHALPSGEEPPLALCLHGFPEVAESWCGQMDLLASLGYRVWAVNQRGYGHSSRPQGLQAYALEELTADVAALIDASGARRVVLLGHDWGGIVAWVFAIRRLRPLERLVIVNVPHPACWLRNFGKGWQFLRSWYVGAFQLPRLPDWWLARDGARRIPESMLRSSSAPGRFPPALLEATRRNAAKPGALQAMIGWYRALVRGGGLRRQMRLGWPAIETPTLLLWGEQDAFLSKRTTEGTEWFVRDLRMELLPGVSHWVQQDAPERCNAALRQFLAR